MDTGSHKSAGFSLVELMLVLAIMSVVAAIAVPRYVSAQLRYQAHYAARRLADDLALAGTIARHHSEQRTVHLDLASHRLTVLAPGQNEPVHQTHLADSPYEARLISADFNGDAEVVFDGYGRPDSGGTAVVEVHGVQRRVIFNASSGRATVP